LFLLFCTQLEVTLWIAIVLFKGQSGTSESSGKNNWERNSMSSCCSIGHTSSIHGGARFGARAAHHHRVETNHQRRFIPGYAPPPTASQIPLRFPFRRCTSKKVILPGSYAPLSLNSSHHYVSDFIPGQDCVVLTDMHSKHQRSSREGGRVSCKLNPELAVLVNTTIPGTKGSPDVAAFVVRPKGRFAEYCLSRS
jgi:hypothetical protein